VSLARVVNLLNFNNGFVASHYLVCYSVTVSSEIYIPFSISVPCGVTKDDLEHGTRSVKAPKDGF